MTHFNVYSRNMLVRRLNRDCFQTWRNLYAKNRRGKLNRADKFYGWLCDCGHWEESYSHCSECGRQPPWGCDCGECDDDAWLDDDDEWWLDEWLDDEWRNYEDE